MPTKLHGRTCSFQVFLSSSQESSGKGLEDGGGGGGESRDPKFKTRQVEKREGQEGLV